MSGTIFTCTVCGMSNVFPVTNITVSDKPTMTIFCSKCAEVTLQRANISSTEANLLKRPEDMSEFTLKSMVEGYGQAPLANTNELLWGRVQEALANNDITVAEFLRCDTSTQTHLLSAMGFTNGELPQVFKLVEVNKLGTRQETPKQQAHQSVTSAKTVGTRDARSISLEPDLRATNGTAVDMSTRSIRSEGAAVETPRPKHAESLLLGLAVQEYGALIARCSVYPNLPAEFWCSLCGVLVSSRCHVTGIHKDHPFITLRQAAEAHVHELSAWLERCRNQLNVATSIVANLEHGKEVLGESIKHQEEKLERYFEDIIYGLTEWREELKSSMRLQVNAQLKNIDAASKRTSAIIEYYAKRQACCDPLLRSIPPVHQTDRQSEEWSLRVMDLVSRLKMSSQEPITMPQITVPEVKSFATVATYMDLLKAVSVPSGIRIPDVLDMGYLNFPSPSDVAQVSFMLKIPEDAKARGILIYSGRTLTRSPNIIPTHSLVCASRVFYTGITAWEVHIDRLGTGPGRILAGVLMAGTDGEGVVWDGCRIVGPNEGECRIVPDRYKLKIGTTLLFVLELEAPSYFLICFYEKEVVARVPLPPALNGWIPAFSVFGPQDQLTVVPTSTTVAVNLLADAMPEAKVKKEEEVKVRLSEQEQKLNALHQQLLAVNSRIDQDKYEKVIHSSTPQREVGVLMQNDKATEEQLLKPPFQEALSNLFADRDRLTKTHTFETTHEKKAAATVTTPALPSSFLTPEGRSEAHGTRNGSYSPELRSLLNFVDSIR